MRSYDLAASIAAKVSKENSWNYYVRPKDRWAALDVWKYCQNIGYPLNTLLEISFPQSTDPSLDVLRVRRLTHYCRIALKQRLGLEHYSMWTRHCARGTTVENDMLLINVPDEHFEQFKAQAESWRFDDVMSDVKVTRVDYDKCIDFEGKLYNVFEVMTRNLDPITHRAEPDACFQPSEPLFRPVLFYSLKIDDAMKLGKVPVVRID